MAGKKRRKISYDDQSLVRTALKWLFVAGLWVAIVLGCLIAWYAAELPGITRDVNFGRKTSITVKAADGSVIARYGEMRGESVKVEDLPPNLVYAVMAIEDRRFYSHFGIDPLGMARAVFTNLKSGRTVQGGSTITQQLAKNLFLSQERTFKRKIQEAILALWLEHELTKDEILSAYLNRVYLGSGTYGVDAAARLYFEKPVQKINLREAAILAGLLKAPSKYSPLQNPELARQRADVVIKAMVDTGYITDKEAKNVKTADVENASSVPGAANAARYYTDWVVDGLDDLIGTPEEDIIVETTLNPALEKTAQAALANVIVANGEKRRISQGAVILMRPDGAVVTMVGGADYSKSQFNRAVQAKRQPGSSFKPVVYLTALQNGWQEGDIILDAPITEGRYRPQNYDGKYRGEVRLDEALAFSLNTVSYRLARALGPDAIIATARNLGIYSKLEPDLSLALGSSSISPLELTTAYATLASGGVAVYPYAITKITSKDGKLYYQRPAKRATRRTVDGHAVNRLIRMMRGVIQFGTGVGANPGFPATGKTGTSQDSRDAWFAGFTNEIVGVVWLGNDDNSPMDRITGGSFPASVWREVMVRARGQYKAFTSYEDDEGYSGPGFQDLLGRILSGGQPQEQEPEPPEHEYIMQGPERYVPPPRQEENTVPGTGHYND